MKKNDRILLLAVIITAIALFAGYKLFFDKPGDYVTVTIDGKLYQTLPLNRDTELDIPGVDGGSNHLEIKNGTAQITDADCPDKLCVHQKKIQNQGEVLVCLPHKLIVQVSSEQEGELDDIAK